MDYQKEYEEQKKQENTTWWQPDVGNYKVKLMSEIGEAYTTKNYPDRPQHNVNIEVDGNPYTFSMGKSGVTGVYGQLIVLGKAEGKLEGLEVSILVKKDKDGKREYTITESIEALQKLKAEEA